MKEQTRPHLLKDHFQSEHQENLSFPELYTADDHVHDHEHPHPHDHHEDHGHNHDEGHDHKGLRSWLAYLFQSHSHSHTAAALDPALSNERGIWAVKVSLIALLITAFFQVGIVAISGSVALLADTAHNFSDALTAIPLGLAFMLTRI